MLTVTTSLGDSRLRPVWSELNARKATVFVHPNAYAPGTHGRPSPLIEVAFDTARTIVDMVYNRVFLDFPQINFVISHCGGALPVLTGRLTLLGAESWVPNPNSVSSEEIRQQIESLWFDTAATAETGLHPAAKVAGIGKCGTYSATTFGPMFMIGFLALQLTTASLWRRLWSSLLNR